MQLTAKLKDIVATSDEFHWASCLSKDGLFILIKTKGDETNFAQVVGEKILGDLVDGFSKSKNRNLATVSYLIDNLKGRSEVETAIIGVLSGKTLYLGSIGKVKVEIRRKDKIGQILGENETALGQVFAGDTLLFYSERFSQVIDKFKREELLNLTIGDEIQQVIDPNILSSNQAKGSAACLLFITSVAPSIRVVPNPFRIAQNYIARLREKIREVSRGGVERALESPEEKRSRKKLLSIAIILLIILVLSIFFNISDKRKSQKNKKLEEAISLVSQQYEEAVSLVDLNPTRARELFSMSKLTLSPLLGEFDKNSAEYKKANEWLEKISTQEVAAYKIYKLTAVPLFFDLTLVKPGGVGDKIASYRQTKAILDSQNKVVYYLSTDTKEAGIIAGAEVVKDANTITVHGRNVYLKNSDGIVGINIADKSSKMVVTSDESWGDIASLASYGGNLYLLDKKNHTIWKYTATESGFSGRGRYLNSDVRVDFSDSFKMVIDGSVFVLTPSDILKFTRGVTESFTLKGISDSMQNLSGISTSEVDRGLYILDKTISRIMVFDKDGVYQSQYQWDELKNVTDFVVSEEEKKIFVMIGSKIYAIDIK